MQSSHINHGLYYTNYAAFFLGTEDNVSQPQVDFPTPVLQDFKMLVKLEAISDTGEGNILI